MLRELLRNVSEYDKAISQSAYALLEALVQRWEAQEVEEHMASLAYVHTELAEAKAEIESLRKQRDGWEEGCWQTEQERDEAKAEWLRVAMMCNAGDAALGRLVREMPRGSSLIHTGPFSTHKRDWGVHRVPGVYEWADDPAEALRSIQEEVGDAEA